MIATVLHAGLQVANRRFGLIFVDLFWKTIWLASTAAVLILALAWYASHIEVPPAPPMFVPILLRDVWNSHAIDLLRMGCLALGICIVVWHVLEAFFRSLILREERGLKPATAQEAKTGVPGCGGRFRSFRTFLVSGLLKTTVFISLAVTLGTLLSAHYTHAAAILVGVVLGALGFVLTIAETLLRSNSVELLGFDLIAVCGVIGTLLLFELIVDGSFAILLIAALLSVPGDAELMMVLGFAAICIVVLNLLHSYLLLVRFSAVDIMRHDAGNI